MWADSEYDHFLHLTPQISGGSYLFLECAGGQDKASEIEFRLAISGENITSTADTYNLVDSATGKYISFCSGGCANGDWVAGDYSSQSDAMPIQLVPKGSQPGSDWGYCTSKRGVPEQVSSVL